MFITRILAVVTMLTVAASLCGVYHKVGECDLSKSQYRMDIQDNIAVLSKDYDAYVYTVDVSDPENPIPLGSCVVGTGSTLVCEIDIHNNTAFLACREQGVKAVDISDPSEPVLIAEYEGISSSAWSVCVENDTAYIGLGGEMLILDVSNPASPDVIGGVNNVDVTHLRVQNGIAVAAGCVGAISFYNVSDPSSVQLLYEFENTQPTFGLEFMYPYCFCMTRFGRLFSFDVSNPDAIVLISDAALGFCCMQMARDGESLYCTGVYRVRKVDVSDPLHPTTLGVCSCYNYASDIYARNGNAFVATRRGMEVFNMMDTGYQRLIRQYDSVQINERMEKNGVALYLHDAAVGVRAWNTTFQDNPFEVSLTEFDNTYVQDMLCDQSHLYLAWKQYQNGVGYIGGFYSLNINNVFVPSIIGEGNYNNIPGRLCRVGEYLYACGNDISLSAHNISDPSAIEFCGELENGLISEDYIVCDTYAYLALDNQMQVVDVSDAYNMEIVAHFGFQFDIEAIDRKDQYVYLVTEYEGLSIFDFSDPSNPVFVGQVEGSGDLCKVTGDWLVVSNRPWNRLMIFDISDPAEPTLIEEHFWNETVYDWELGDGLIYVACGYGGMCILESAVVSTQPDVPAPPTTLALSGYPNPFNPVTTIAYSLPEAADVRLDVYDIRGRLVERLVQGLELAGEHEVVWNAEDSASGVYLVRLHTDDRESATRLVLLK